MIDSCNVHWTQNDFDCKKPQFYINTVEDCWKGLWGKKLKSKTKITSEHTQLQPNLERMFFPYFQQGRGFACNLSNKGHFHIQPKLSLLEVSAWDSARPFGQVWVQKLAQILSSTGTDPVPERLLFCWTERPGYMRGSQWCLCGPCVWIRQTSFVGAVPYFFRWGLPQWQPLKKGAENRLLFFLPWNECHQITLMITMELESSFLFSEMFQRNSSFFVIRLHSICSQWSICFILTTLF